MNFVRIEAHLVSGSANTLTQKPEVCKVESEGGKRPGQPSRDANPHQDAHPCLKDSGQGSTVFQINILLRPW